MPEIEDAHTNLDRLSGQVEQYGKDILDVTNEPPYSSFAKRAERAGRLAAELAVTLNELDTDVDTYLNTLSSFDDQSEACQKLQEAASSVVVGGSPALTGIPGEILQLGMFGVAVPVAFVKKHTGPLAGYAANVQRAATGLNKLNGVFTEHRTKITDEVQQHTSQIRAHIQEGKATL